MPDTRTRDLSVLSSGTSASAAALQTESKVNRVQATITVILAENGPLTDEEIVDRYNARAGSHPSVPRVTPQNIRTRRHDLVVRGLVGESGLPGFSALGNPATRWALT